MVEKESEVCPEAEVASVEVRGRRAEVRGRRSEVRGPGSEVRGAEGAGAEGGRGESTVRGPRSTVRGAAGCTSGEAGGTLLREGEGAEGAEPGAKAETLKF